MFLEIFELHTLFNFNLKKLIRLSEEIGAFVVFFER
jgi:hypothetical protein